MSWLDGITEPMDMSLSHVRSWWWTGRPEVLQSMRSHDWATELNWTEQQSKVERSQPGIPLQECLSSHTGESSPLKQLLYEKEEGTLEWMWISDLGKRSVQWGCGVTESQLENQWPAPPSSEAWFGKGAGGSPILKSFESEGEKLFQESTPKN